MSKISKDRSRIEQACKEAGLRMTGQRRIIARVVGSAEDHPDVYELHRRALLMDKTISISTVYRTMKLFEDKGIITRQSFGDGRARYERVPDKHHDHIINLKTGAVIEFHSAEIEQLQAQIVEKLGFKLVDHRLDLYCVPLDDGS